jgi:hypothetical protein
MPSIIARTNRSVMSRLFLTLTFSVEMLFLHGE